MAITTQAGAIAGMMPPVHFAKATTATLVANAPQSFYTLGGTPSAGAANSGLTGAVYSSSSAVPAGFLYHLDPPSADAYLARLVATVTIPGTLLLLDRLWDCEPATDSTAAQTITPPTWPARDINGSTAGLGVQLGIEVIAATSSTAAVVSVSYTNSAGTASRTGAFIDLPTAATTAIGRFFRIGLQAGDYGVQSVQTVTFSTDWTSGTIALVAYRVIAKMDIQLPNVANQIDAVSAALPRIYNGSCLFFVFIPETTTASFLSGCYEETQG